MKTWAIICFSKPVMKRASWSAVIVGTILIVINHGNAILKGDVDLPLMLQMSLNVIVPYVVSTVSSASTLLSAQGTSKLEESTVRVI